MKALWALVVILFTFTITMDEAQARRMGGGKTFGRSYQTAPQTAPNKSTADAPAQRQQAATPAPGAGRGLMGGLLGGLLVGGLFAALFAGGAFEGMQMMDILIIAALAFIIFKVIRGLRQGSAPVRTGPQPVYAGAGQPAPQQPSRQEVFGSRREAPVAAPVSSAATSHAVPFNLPLGFDTPAFLEGAKEHYRILQEAWNKNDLAKIQEYVTPELYAELLADRASLTADPHTDVLSVNAELVRADQQFGNAEVSIRFSGHCRDTVEGSDESFVDVWHLERDYSKENAPWHITGMQSE